MISRKEIMIGNYIKDRGGKVLRVDFIEYFGENRDCKYGQLQFINGVEVHPMTEFESQAEPVDLNYEWLRKFGFDRNMEKGRFEFIHIDGLRVVGESYDYNGIWIGSINYVHKLQNLYYAITGEELSLEVES